MGLRELTPVEKAGAPTGRDLTSGELRQLVTDVASRS